jgi:CRP-like cAMP-binding protein
VALYVLEKGEVTLEMSSLEGKPILSFGTTAGSLLGLPGLIGNQPYSLTASVAGQAEIYRIDRDNFKAILERDAGSCMDALRILAAEVRFARIALRDHLDRWARGEQ